MYQGNWTCSSCNGSITELPFQPRSEQGLTCRTCYAKRKGGTTPTAAPVPDMPVATEAPDIPDFTEADIASEPAPPEEFSEATPMASSERPSFSGEWSCAECGSSITSLPFEPRSTNNLKCLDCFKRSKA